MQPGGIGCGLTRTSTVTSMRKAAHLDQFVDGLVVGQVGRAVGVADVVAEADEFQVGAAVVPLQLVAVVDLHGWRDLPFGGYPHDAVRADGLRSYADFAVEVRAQRFGARPVAPP